jgi:hypothetical protein
MPTMRTIKVLVAVLGIGLSAAAQDDSNRQEPVSPLGDNAPILNPDNPPVSGVDEAGLDMRSGERSFFSYGLSASETADSNANNQLGGRNLSSVTHLLGAMDLQRLYTKTDIFAEYLGGGAFYSDSTSTVRQMHAAGVMGVMRWRTGRLTARDSFSYLPEGTFSVGAFGGVPGLGIATGSGESGLAGGGLPGSHFFGNGQFGSVGLTPRITNSALVSVVQSLTPRSAFTIAGGFSNAHFFDDTGVLINSDRELIEGGYSYMLGRRDQIGAVYGFQQFRFPQDAGGQIDSHVINLRWGHTISGRMSVILGGGPEYLTFEVPPPPEGGPAVRVSRWSSNGRAVLRYRFTRTSLALSYEKLTTAGSGFFAGSDTQAVRAGITRPLARTWELYGDLGYSHNRRLQEQLLKGLPGNTFDHGFVRVMLRKHLGREWSAFFAYRFNDLAFDNKFCSNVGGFCSRISQRHMASIGLEWHPRPMRID